MASNSEKGDRESAAPAFKTRCGRIHAAVFTQTTSKGTMYSVTVKRTYRTESGEFKDAYSFSMSDLDDIARAFNDIKAWAKTHGQAQGEEE